MWVVSIYVNPSQVPRKLEEADLIFEEVSRIVEDAVTMNLKCVVAGDFNQHLPKYRTLARKHCFSYTKFVKTRHSDRGKETDMIFTNIGPLTDCFSRKPVWGSDHLLIISEHKLYNPPAFENIITKNKISAKKEQIKEIALTINVCSLREIMFSISTLFRPSTTKASHMERQRCREITNRVVKPVSRYGKIKAFFQWESNRSAVMSREAWKLIANYMSGKKVHLVKGIKETDGTIVTDPNQYRSLVFAWGNEKWKEDKAVIAERNQGINDLIKSYYLKTPKWEYFSVKEIYQVLNTFPFDTTFGPDYLLPLWMEEKDDLDQVMEKQRLTFETDFEVASEIEALATLSTSFASKMSGMIVNKLTKTGLQKDWNIARLVLLSKEDSPIAPVTKVRPIAIQSLPTRIVEKLILNKLKACDCRSIEVSNYQTGFQDAVSVQVNIIRALRKLQANRKISVKEKRDVFVLLDLSSAYDRVSRLDVVKMIKLKCARC